MNEFEFRTGKVIIDQDKCKNCDTYACVKACSLYGRGILRIQAGEPVLGVNLDEAKRLCTECLACEQNCKFEGKGALKIMLPILGLKKSGGS